MTDQNETENWLAIFQPLSTFTGTMQRNARKFWNTQAEILNSMQAYADGWFQRRHIGVQAAQEACERMCAAKTPIEWFQEYQQWGNGVFQRLMADGMVLQQVMQKIAEEVTPALVPAISKEQPDASAATGKKRERVE
jgi:hypothetical protein